MLNRIAAKKTPRGRRYKLDDEGKPVRGPSGAFEVLAEWDFRPLSASSVNRCRTVALEVIALAAEEGEARPINSRRVPKRTEEPLDIRPYGPRELRVLWLRSKGSIAELPVFLMGFLGLTVNEALALNREDLTPQGVLSVGHQMKRTGERSKRMKTPYRHRRIPLPRSMMDELRPFAFGTGPLCLNSKEDPTRTEAGSLDRAVASKMRLAGLPHLTLHQLRHSFSSWLEENGCPRAVRLALMGQSRRAVADRYNHASDEAMREWLDRLWQASLLEYEDGSAPVPVAPRLGPIAPATGARNGRTKLDDEKVAEILRRAGEGEGDAAIAKDFGVDPQAIRQIRLGISWKHVPRKAVDAA